MVMNGSECNLENAIEKKYRSKKKEFFHHELEQQVSFLREHFCKHLDYRLDQHQDGILLFKSN
jgi:hypothetical protein